MSDTLQYSTTPSFIFDRIDWQVNDFPSPIASAAAPALTIFKDTAFCMHRGPGVNQELFHLQYIYANQQWSPETNVPGGQQSVYGPALAMLGPNVPNGDKLYCAYTGTDTDTYITSSTDGIYWSNPLAVSSKASFAPAMTLFKGALWCVTTLSWDKNRLIGLKSSDGQHWTAVPMGTNHTSKAASLAVFHDKLWCVFRGLDDKNLYYMTCDGASWTAAKPIPRHTTDCEPALVFVAGDNSQIPDRLLCLYGDSNGDPSLYYTYTEDAGPSGWTEPKKITGDTIKRAKGTGVGVVVHNRILTCVFRSAAV
ncbi:hypothetical protein [Phyllobacterium leguminum]|uniref:BNR repeat protein n=1 Tax=Phyllobacterium leguminum TaxID=314237 RepID=A0A318T2M9_9HYPH|nr:hypothetical protein [Phyllobacterium leguminum]PYE87062.1 hypothetical protein C7477_11620 [Phyllobacterium leguminum]